MHIKFEAPKPTQCSAHTLGIGDFFRPMPNDSILDPNGLYTVTYQDNPPCGEPHTNCRALRGGGFYHISGRAQVIPHEIVEVIARPTHK